MGRWAASVAAWLIYLGRAPVWVVGQCFPPPGGAPRLDSLTWQCCGGMGQWRAATVMEQPLPQQSRRMAPLLSLALALLAVPRKERLD